MDGQSTCRIYLMFLMVTGAAVCAKDVAFNFSSGMIESMVGNCGLQAIGSWKEDNATNFFVKDGTLGPQDGKVIVSQMKEITCIKIPGLTFDDLNFTMRILLFVNESNTADNKLQVNLLSGVIPAGSKSTKSPLVAGWEEVDLPIPTLRKPPQPPPYTVELWALDKHIIAVRSLIVTTKDIPQDTTLAPSTEASTAEDPDSETTTENFADETTTELIHESSSTSESNTEPPQTTKRTTVALPQPTSQPLPQIFPDIWSLLLGIVIGILLTSLVVFVATCFWWFWGATGKKIIIENNPAYTLPRLEVISNSRQKSITGSMGSETMSIDPFWIKSKGWAHIP